MTLKERKPMGMPVKVFDDGRKTFIQFPEQMLARNLNSMQDEVKRRFDFDD